MNSKKENRIKVLDSLPLHTEYLSRMALEDKYRKIYYLCKSVFEPCPTLQMHGDWSPKCIFCGGRYTKDRDGTINHRNGCPCITWEEIKRG